MDRKKPLHWEQLEDDFKKGHSIVLFLGTGVNMGVRGIDYSWNALLNHLLRYATSQVTHRGEEVMAKMLQSSVSELIKNDASLEDLKEQVAIDSIFPREVKSTIVKQTIGNESFVKLIQDFLYRQMNREKLEKAANAFIIDLKNNGPKLERHIDFFSLFSVVDLILRNRNIRAVVTQNYDQFLCDAMNKMKDDRVYRHYVEGRNVVVRDISPSAICDWKGQTKFTYDGINIYHVHGFIPRYEEIQAPKNNRIVLSMDEFYEDSRNVYSWQIASQLHFLSQYTCIFCGLSLDDYTNQRLLHYVKGKHHGNLYYLTAGSDDSRVKDRIKNEFHEKNGLTVLYDENGFKHLYKLLRELQYEYNK